MDMKRISSGKLRAIGYDPKARTLRVEFDDGRLLEYTGVGDEIWRRLSGSSSAWSVFRDSVEEVFTGRRVSGVTAARPANPLDDLFKKKNARTQCTSPVRRIEREVKLTSAVCPDVPMMQAKYRKSP